MKQHQQKIKEILKRSEDSHNIFTSFELCEEMIEKIPDLNGNVLVMFNLEFLLVLREKLGKERLQNVWFLTPCEFKKKAAVKIGIKENQINIYEYNTKAIKGKDMPKFDVVIGNPPYQAKKMGGGAGSGNAIWQNFVELSFNILKEKGYLCFVHPVDWRTTDSRKKRKAQKLLFKNQISYLKTQISPFTGVGAIVDWYVAQKTPTYKKTKIDFLDGLSEIKIETPPIYAYGNELTNSIKNKVLLEKDNGLFQRKGFGGLVKFDETKSKGKYKFAHGAGFIKGEWKYYEHPHIHQNVPKVIMSAVRKLRPIYDKGEIGIGDHVHYILVKNEKEGEFLKSILNSKLGTFLQKIFATTFWDGDSSHWNNPYPISKIRIDDKELKTDNDVYKYFNLTKEEINYVESQIK